MKSTGVKNYLAGLLGFCMLGVCSACGQDDNAAQKLEITEISDEDYVPDEAAESGSGAADQESGQSSDAASQMGETQTSEEPPQTDDGGQPDKDFTEEPANGRSLTEEELKEYTAWIQERTNYGFLLSEWDNPTQLNLYEVFYTGAGIAREGTEAEKKAFLDRNGLTEINTDFYAMDKSDVSAMVFEKVGLTYDELVAKGSEGLENWYDAENDSFCTEAGDTNYVQFVCTDGIVNEEETRVILHCEGDEWVEACEVKVAEGEGERAFLKNHIISGLILDVE